MMYNEGLFKQIKNNPISKTGKRTKITHRDIALLSMFVFKTYTVKYSEPAKTEEEFDIALEHYFLVKSWGL